MWSCQSGKNPRDDTVWALLPPPLSLKKILATHLAYVQSKYTNGIIIIIIIIIIILILLLFSLSLFLVKVDTTATSALCIVGQ